MAGPVASDLHVDVPLTQMSIGYSNPTYIADQIFPIVQVNKQSNIVPKYDQSHWFRDEAKLRARGTESRGGGWAVDVTDTYFCHRYSWHKEISDEDRDNADAPWNLEREAVEYVTDKLLMRRERAFAADFFATGIWTGADVDGGVNFTKWSDYGSSTPLIDIDTYRDTVEATIGREPNVCVMGKQVWLKLKWHPDLVDTIKYTQRGVVTHEIFQALADLQKCLIGRTIVTTSAEGTAEASVTYSRIWGKHCLLIYVPTSPSLMTPAAGYTFVWARVPGALQYIKRFRFDQREVDRIESNGYFDHKQTAARAGAFLENAVA